MPTTIIAGTYELLTPLGEGGMGTVYKARQRNLDRLCAIKFLRTDGMTAAELHTATARFRDEAHAAAAVDHPRLVQVYDSGVDDERGPFIVYQFLAGETLTGYLETKGALPWPTVRGEVAQPLLSALEVIHEKGIIHRDVKPDNMIRGNDGTFLLTDLGLALFSTRKARTATGLIIGTPGYLAPECLLSRDKAGPAGDIYGAAMVIVRSLAGRLPFKSTDLAGLVAEQTERDISPRDLKSLAIPHELANPLAAALARDPSARPQRATTFLQRLEGTDTATVTSQGTTTPGAQQTTTATMAGQTTTASMAQQVATRSLEPQFSLRRLFPIIAALLCIAIYWLVAANDQLTTSSDEELPTTAVPSGTPTTGTPTASPTQKLATGKPGTFEPELTPTRAAELARLKTIRKTCSRNIKTLRQLIHQRGEDFINDPEQTLFSHLDTLSGKTSTRAATVIALLDELDELESDAYRLGKNLQQDDTLFWAYFEFQLMTICETLFIRNGCMPKGNQDIIAASRLRLLPSDTALFAEGFAILSRAFDELPLTAREIPFGSFQQLSFASYTMADLIEATRHGPLIDAYDEKLGPLVTDAEHPRLLARAHWYEQLFRPRQCCEASIMLATRLFKALETQPSVATSSLLVALYSLHPAARAVLATGLSKEPATAAQQEAIERLLTRATLLTCRQQQAPYKRYQHKLCRLAVISHRALLAFVDGDLAFGRMLLRLAQSYRLNIKARGYLRRRLLTLYDRVQVKYGFGPTAPALGGKWRMFLAFAQRQRQQATGLEAFIFALALAHHPTARRQDRQHCLRLGEALLTGPPANRGRLSAAEIRAFVDEQARMLARVPKN